MALFLLFKFQPTTKIQIHLYNFFHTNSLYLRMVDKIFIVYLQFLHYIIDCESLNLLSISDFPCVALYNTQIFKSDSQLNIHPTYCKSPKHKNDLNNLAVDVKLKFRKKFNRFFVFFV